MAKTQFRTADELKRAQWAEKFTMVSEGTLYKKEGLSPFPIHEYFKLGLLGKNVRMLELNAGAALIDQMVADAVTDMKIEADGQEDEIKKWLNEVFYNDTLEQTARSYFANGYAVQQPIRDIDEKNKNTYTVINVDPDTWYPTVPTFKYQKITEGRIISVFSEKNDGVEDWYAFVEIHVKGRAEHELYRLENSDDLEGAQIDLSSLPQFSDLDESVPTKLPYLGMFQIDRTKGAGRFFGESIFTKIWEQIHEISQIKTQMRQERIKHFRSKLAAPIQVVQRAQRLDDTDSLPDNSKIKAIQDRVAQAAFDFNQEIFPVPPGSTVMPQFIQRDLDIIDKAMDMIDKCLSEIAFTVGAPRSIFNLDEKGTIHVETEKKKDRRYMRHIEQCQRKLEWMTEQSIRAVWHWKTGKELKGLKVTLTSPFEMSTDEKVEQYRKMNPNASFISKREAVKNLWPDMDEDEREQMIQEIDEENSVPGIQTPVEL